MIPAVSAQGHALRPAYSSSAQPAQRTAQDLAPEAARQSAGESSASNTRPDTSQSVDPARQGAVPPRLRDEETVERSARRTPEKDTPTGPPPAFEESPLERQARVALDPPEPTRPGAASTPQGDDLGPAAEEDGFGAEFNEALPEIEVPPTPHERAEASFAETRSMSSDTNRPQVDVKN